MSKKDKLFDSDDDENDYNPDDDLGFDSPPKQQTHSAPKEEPHQPPPVITPQEVMNNLHQAIPQPIPSPYEQP